MALVVTSFEAFQRKPILAYEREDFAKRLETWAFYIFKPDDCPDDEKDFAATQRMILISFGAVLQTSMDVTSQLFPWSPPHSKEEKLNEFIARIDHFWDRLGQIVERVILAATGLGPFTINGWSSLDRDQRADAMVELQRSREMADLIADVEAFNREAGDVVIGIDAENLFLPDEF